MNMASGRSNKGDEDYETSLRRLMQICLPPILAEIVDRRPPNPIEYLARGLYRFREDASELEKMSASAAKETDIVVSGNTTRKPGSHSGTSVKVLTKTNSNIPGVGLVQDDFGDEGLGEIRDDLSDVTGNMVHTSEERVLVTIGDIFDDCDIT